MVPAVTESPFGCAPAGVRDRIAAALLAVNSHLYGEFQQLMEWEDEMLAFANDAAIRADERRVMCDEKDATIKRLTARVESFREAVWEYLIYPGDDGYTASGYSQDDIPDEQLRDAIVDAS
jgi:hypothetical protein